MGEKGKERKAQQGQTQADKVKPSSNLPPSLQKEAGPLTTFDPELGDSAADKGMPSVSLLLGYLLRSNREDGQSVSRPFLITSVDTNNQHCNGFVFLEPNDVTPVNGRSIGELLYFVRDIPFGTSGQTDTWHYVSKGYSGRIGGFTGHKASDLPITEEVKEGN